MSRVMNMDNIVMEGMKETCVDYCCNVIRELSRMYNFDSEEAIGKLNLDDVKVNIVEKVKKVKPEKVKVAKVAKVEKVKKVTSKYPMPFNNKKNDGCCEGLRQNHSLYTQCENLKLNDNEYCKKCNNESLKNDSGKPDYGTISDRLECGIYEFRDAKGKSPIAYTKLMSKLKFTREEVEEEAKKLNYEIDPIHFEYTEEPKRGRPKSEKKVKDANATSSGKKGRPKKMNKEVELTSDVGEDIFASLVENANANVVNANATQVVNIVVSEVPTKVDTPEKSEKVVEQEAKKTENDAKKAEKEAKKVENDAKKVENDAKKAEKEAKKAENDAKKAEKDAKKAEKDAKKAENDAKKAEKKPEEEVDVVRKFEYEGTTYLKSKSTGVIYNMDQDLVGKWNEETQKIDFEDIDDEEEEDEYDE